jgi:RHS repeat-associated protein
MDQCSNMLRRVLVVSFPVLLFCSMSVSQDTPGTTLDPHDYDTIDLHSLSVTLNIPIRSVGGPVPDSYEWNLSERIYKIGNQLYMGDGHTVTSGPILQTLGAFGFGIIEGPTGYYCVGYGICFSTVTSNVPCGAGVTRSQYSGAAIVDVAGVIHDISNGSSWHYFISPYGSCTSNYASWIGNANLNHEGIYVDASGFVSGTVHVRDKRGFDNLGQIDPDGNIATLSTNSLGAAFLTAITGGGYSYSDASGNTQPVTQTTITPTFRSNWNCPSTTDYNQPPTGRTLLTAVNYPDGTSLAISYEGTAGYSGDYTGRIASLILRTGATITYTYGGGNAPGPGVGMYCGVWGDGDGYGPTVLTRTDSGPGVTAATWTYTAAHSLGTSGASSTTTVTDPSGNNVVHTFINNRALHPSVFEVMTQYYLGGGINCATGCTSSTLLKTVYYCYNGWNPANLPGDTGTLPTACGNVNEPYTNTFAGGMTEEDVYTAIAGVSGISEVAKSYDNNGNVSTVKRYDFGASTPTEITSFTYGSYANGTCQTIGTVAQNILDRKCEVTVSDGTHTISDTRYTYNSTGHPTTVSFWTGSAWLSTSAIYNTNGTVLSATSIDGISSTYSYNGPGGCDSLLPTSITTAGLTSSFTWDCNTGAQLSSTDPNSSVTSASYTVNGADPLYRVKSVAGALGETVNYFYSDSPTATSVEAKMSFTASSQNVTHDAFSYADGLGRPYLHQALDTTNYDTSNTTWNWKPSGGTFKGITTLGAVIERVAVPCNTTLGSTCPGTPPLNTSYLDALGRVTTLLDAGGGTLSSQYIGKDVLTTKGPTPVGEDTKSVQTEYDGLGRKISICQVQVNGGSSCGQANAGNGTLTTISYTMLAGGTQVTITRGSQVHTKKYDALGRLTQWTSPERGTLTYIYDTQSSTCGSHTLNGHLVEFIDNAQNHVCYTYDTTMSRLIQVSSVPASTCLYYAYGDNAPTPPTGVSFLNGKGRVVAAYTSATCGDRTALTTDEWFSYDNEGHITDMWEATPHSGGYYHTTAAYFVDGTLQSLSGIPGYTAITYGLDAVGRSFTSAEGSTNVVSGVTYNYSSQPLTISIGNPGRDTSNFGYDPNTGRMTNWIFTVGSTPQSQTGTLNWNPNGTLGSLFISDGFNAGGSQNCYFGKASTQTPGYDGFGRLISADCTPVWSQTFSYDQYDNITKTGSSSWACPTCYNTSNNQYNTSISASIAYDANGRLMNDTFQKYQWNPYGQLTGTLAATGGNITCGSGSSYCYTYDALGRMVEGSQGSTYFEMLYSALGKTGQMKAQVPSYSYLPLPGGGTLYSTGNTGTTRYYQHKDWLGSVRVESTLGNRTVTYDRAFAPYGEGYNNFGATGQLNFTGDTQDFDTASALFDTPNRELHVTQGRWISPDPVDGDWNAYAYTTDPNVETDVNGLCASDPSDPYCVAHPEVYAYLRSDPKTGNDVYCDCGRSTVPVGRTIPSDPNRDPSNSWGNMGTQAAQVMFQLGNPDWGPNLSSRMPVTITTAWNHFKFGGSTLVRSSSSDSPSVAAMASADVDVTMNIETNVRTLAPAMQQGAAFANAATKYTGYAYAAAATVAVGGPHAMNAVLRGIGWAQGTFGAGTGVLLGRYYNEAENYIVDAKEMGANYFNLGGFWKVGNYFGDAWVANRVFIDASIVRGQQFFLNQGPLGPAAVGTYGREIDYLLFETSIPNSQISTAWF